MQSVTAAKLFALGSLKCTGPGNGFSTGTGILLAEGDCKQATTKGLGSVNH